MKKPLLLLGLVITTGHLLAAEELPLDRYHGEAKTVPTGATVSLRLPASVMIGEQIPAALLIGNAGTAQFEITTGGDYRSTGYPQRMKVRVRDADGHLLPELSMESYGGGGGGFVQSKSIAPGGSETIDFPLDCYVNFPRAGTYFVTAGHDLGWKIEKDHPHPLGQASLLVTAPTASQAAALVEKTLASQPNTPPTDESDRLSRELQLERHLCILRHPVYLPALAKAAQAGSKAAVMGIGNIAGPAATEALIALLDHASPEIISTSGSQILKRLPSRADPTKPAQSRRWPNLYLVDPLLPSSWEPEFEKPLMDATLKLLSSDNHEVLNMAGDVIALRGEPKDAPAILAVLQKSLDVYQSPRRGENANTLDPPKPQRALISALDALRKRGWRTDGAGGTAELLAWFRQIADPTIPPPAGDEWKDRMLTWIENGPGTLRICALQAIPQPMPEPHVAAVLKALEDPDLGVVRVACEVAGASKRPIFAKPLVQILETERESFTQDAAANAAIQCGAHMELWQAWTSSITSEKRMSEAIRALINGTIELPHSSSGGGSSNFTREQRFAIRDAWRAFLKQHQESISRGGRVPLSDPETIAGITGLNFHPDDPAVSIHFDDGTKWPSLPEK